MDSNEYGIEIMKEIKSLFKRLNIQERDFFHYGLKKYCSIHYNEKFYNKNKK
jgi:hypothetical protein